MVLDGGQVGVYIDFDNIVMSRYDELHGFRAFRDDRASSRNRTDVVQRRLSEAAVDIDAIIDFASSFGTAAILRAYADWSTPVNAGYATATLRRSIDLVQLFPMSGMKNGADIRLAIDVIDDLSRYPDLTHVVVVAGDSDYVALAQRCKRLGRRVIGIGASRSVGRYWQQACDEFRLYGNLPGVRATAETAAVTGFDTATAEPDPAVVALDANGLLLHACALVRLRSDKEWLSASEVKNQMKRLNPTFDEAALGHPNFSAFLRSAGNSVSLRETATAGYEIGLASVTAEAPGEAPPVEASKPRTMSEDLRMRLVNAPEPVSQADEQAFVIVMQTIMRIVRQDPSLVGSVPRAALVDALVAGGMQEPVARRAAHTISTSGLPLVLHDDVGKVVVNPDLDPDEPAGLLSLFRRWTADRARNLDGYEHVPADLLLSALYGDTQPDGAAADVGAALTTASVGTMRRALGARLLPPQVLWDVCEAAAGLRGDLARLTPDTFAGAITPGLRAVERDPETVDWNAAYLALSEAGLCGDAADGAVRVVDSGQTVDVAALVLTGWASRLLTEGHLVPDEFVSRDAFYRLCLPDRSSSPWRSWARSIFSTSASPPATSDHGRR